MKIPLFPVLLLTVLIAEAVPSNVVLNQPATVSSQFSSSYPPQLAVDGDTSSDSSRWLSADTTPPHWIEIDLEQTYILSRLTFWTGHSTGNFPLDDYALQFWDGNGWTDLYSETGSTDDDGSVDVSFAPTLSGNRVRLNVTAVDPANTDSIVRLFEIEIHGELPSLYYTGQLPEAGGTLVNHGDDLVLSFNASISAIDLSGVRIENLDTSSDVTGVSTSTSGSDLIISHPDLAESTAFAVHIPAGAVSLSGDPSSLNGSIYWEFASAALQPQLLSHTDELPGLTGDIEFHFDRAITVSNPGGITIKRASDNSLVTGVSVSVTGETLSISHDAFSPDEAYIAVFAAGSIIGQNGQSNTEYRRIVFAGSSDLINASFTDDANGFQFAIDHFSSGISNYQDYWRRSDGSSIGPDADNRFLLSRTNWMQDLIVSPAVSLSEAATYTLRFRNLLERGLTVGYLPASAFPGSGTAADVLAQVTVVTTVASGGPRTTNQTFSPAANGDYHLIFFTGDTNANQDQQLDSISLTRSINPVVAFNSPIVDSSFLESDNIAIEVEAYGISAPITDVSLYDDGALIGSMTKDGQVYTYDWDYHSPGNRVLSAIATDALGNTSTSEVSLTVTFDNGSLQNYIGWDFDDSKQGWTFYASGSEVLSGSALRTLSSGTRQPGREIVFNNRGSNGLAVSSPSVFLRAGETYTLSFDGQFNFTSTWGFLPTDEPGYPSDTSGKVEIRPSTTSWANNTLTFSVSADGPYHLTIFAPLSGYWGARLDDIRLIGNFNSAPLVSLTSPESAVTTISGATITLKADASDPDGTVSKVDFKDSAAGNLVDPAATDLTAPWEILWNTSLPGTYDVFAEATDDANGVGASGSRRVTVAPNLYSISTYIGNTATDEAFTGAAYLSDGTLLMGGILDPALFSGITPLYLNGSSTSDRGVVVRLSEDGQNVLSVTVVGTRVLDIDTDGNDRIFVAAGDDGAVVLNSAADAVLWSNDYGTPHVHRIDAANGGTFALITSSTFDYLGEKINSGTNYAYDSTFSLLGSMGGVAAFTTDVAVDEASETIILIGWKNVASMEDDTGTNPVDIPGMVGRAYDGALKWRAYDWEKQSSGNRWLNFITSNMADTRGCRVIVGLDGKVYAGIEFDGGNTPLRYDPFDITLPVSVVGGDSYHSMSNTSTVPKTFVGRYDAGTGAYETGQWITNRLSNGSDNTIRIKNGNLMVDLAGRIHVVGGSASGLPMTHDPLSGVGYSGGAYHLVYSPDFSSREYLTRLTLSSGSLSHYAGVAISQNGHVATAGRSNSPYLFDVNAWQNTLDTGYDAHFAVLEPDAYYKFQSGEHPRLFFSSEELVTIRSRLTEEPYASMYAALIANRDFGNFYRPYNSSNSRDLFGRAQASAYLYALSADESYAEDARDDIETALGIIGNNWASPSVNGLELYGYATDLAVAYDLCATSEVWDTGFNYQMSQRLKELAEVIVNDGGTNQPSDLGSNWRGARGASAGLAFLATDHSFAISLADTADGYVQNYLNFNQGPNAVGWNPEGFGYTAYALGNYVGPYGIAAERADTSNNYRNDTRLEGMLWTGFSGATTAYNVYGLGGVKTDWSDDNAHTGGEGVYGLAFYYSDSDLQRGLKHAYDRFMGTLSPFGANWDGVQHGTFWSILYYPDNVPTQDPTEVWDWHRRSSDTGGIGVFSFRDGYTDEDDILVQFKARLKAPTEAHDGPDGLGFRLIGLDDAFVVGGGRDLDLGELNQATVYPSNPNNDVTRNKNTGSLVGTPLIKPNGGGHAIASMATNNVGTSSHKRWLVTDYDAANTGAAAVIIVADTTSNGVYWQLPTFLNNTVTTSGNTFMITGTSGATLKGTILHPGSNPVITTGTKARGSGYNLANGGTLATEDPVTNPRIEDNRYLFIEHGGDGDFLVVMTLMKSGAHPSVSQTSGTVASAVIKVGSKNYALQSDDVFYSTGSDSAIAYVVPDATVTFDADGKGSLGGAAIQSIPYGGTAVAPVVTPDAGYTFTGWNKSFTQAVKSMTVTALYDVIASGFGSWISDGLWGLDAADQDPKDNPDFDAFNNLLEYAFVLNPSIPDGDGVISAREESGNIILSYRVRENASGLTVTPRYSADMTAASWTDVPSSNIVPTGSGANYIEYEASMPIGDDPIFIILQVTE